MAKILPKYFALSERSRKFAKQQRNVKNIYWSKVGISAQGDSKFQIPTTTIKIRKILFIFLIQGDIQSINTVKSVLEAHNTTTHFLSERAHFDMSNFIEDSTNYIDSLKIKAPEYPNKKKKQKGRKIIIKEEKYKKRKKKKKKDKRKTKQKRKEKKKKKEERKMEKKKGGCL